MFDNISSEDYDLYIGSMDNNTTQTSSASTNTEIIYESVQGRDENFVFGVKNNQPVLTFTMKLFSYNKLSRNDISYIDNWLFSQTTPKQLVICQDDMTNYYYMATFSKNDIISFGNVPMGFECTVTCDSSYGYEFEKQEVFSLSNGKGLFRFNNLSAGLNYLYPKLEFVCNKDNGQIKIKNISDNNREFYIWGLQKGEVVKIDNWFQIESSTGLLRMSQCNKQWLGLVRGINRIEINGDTSSVSMKYKFKRGIGS